MRIKAFSKQNREHKRSSQREKNVVNSYKLKQVFSSSPQPTMQFFLLLLSKLLQGCGKPLVASSGTRWEKRCYRTLLSLPHGQIHLLSAHSEPSQMLAGSPVSLSGIGKNIVKFSGFFAISKASLPF